MSQGKAELEFIKNRNKDIQGTTNHAWEYRCGFLEEDSHFWKILWKILEDFEISSFSGFLGGFSPLTQ